jgi:hypothetical protein
MAPPARASFVARCRKDARVLGQLCLLGLGHAQEPSSRGRVAFTTVVVLELLSTSPSCAEAELLLLLPHVFRLIAPHMPPHAQVAAPASPLHLPCISPASPLHLPCVSPVSPLYLHCVSPVSPLRPRCLRTRRSPARCDLARISPTSRVHLAYISPNQVAGQMLIAQLSARAHLSRDSAARARTLARALALAHSNP